MLLFFRVYCTLYSVMLIEQSLYVHKFSLSLDCSCETERKTCPLSKITDIVVSQSVRFQRKFGLTQLTVQTAGQGMGASGMPTSKAVLVGLVDARTFRSKVIAQRNKITGEQAPCRRTMTCTRHLAAGAPLAAAGAAASAVMGVAPRLAPLKRLCWKWRVCFGTCGTRCTGWTAG